MHPAARLLKGLVAILLVVGVSIVLVFALQLTMSLEPEAPATVAPDPAPPRHPPNHVQERLKAFEERQARPANEPAP